MKYEAILNPISDH